jgi:hypothetical protein
MTTTPAFTSRVTLDIVYIRRGPTDADYAEAVEDGLDAMLGSLFDSGWQDDPFAQASTTTPYCFARLRHGRFEALKINKLRRASSANGNFAA